jgi:hypothetical protein
LLQQCGPRALILADSNVIRDGLDQWSDERVLDLRHDLEGGIADFAKIQSTWQSVSRHFDIHSSHEDCLFGLRNRVKKFDIFVSYKSEDVGAARKLTESLLQLGLSVWMAEYAVLLTGQSAFQASINEGLAASSRAVILSNSRFAESAYCQMEALLALQLIPYADILELRMPNELHRFSSLFEAMPLHGLDWNERSPDQSVMDVCELFHFPKPTGGRSIASKGDLSQIELPYRDIRASVRIGGWQIQQNEFNLWENRATTVAEFAIPLIDQSLSARLMIVDAEFGISITEDGRSAFATAPDDDRELAKIARLYFTNHYRFNHRFKCNGVHIWLWNRRMMPAFTWFQGMKDPESDLALDSSWNLLRQYSVFLDHPVSGKPLECRFLFEMRGADDVDAHALFRRFLVHADQMEQLAASLSLAEGGECDTEIHTSGKHVELAIRRAIAVMALVHRAYEEEEWTATTVGSRKQLAERRRPIEDWIKNDGLARYLSETENGYLSAPLGTWSPYLRPNMRNRQAQIPIFLWYAGIEPRPAVATHPLGDIYDKTWFCVENGWASMLEKALAASAPSDAELSDFAAVCVMALARFRRFRAGVKHNPKFMHEVNELLVKYNWSRPVDTSLVRASASGDLYVSLFNRSIELLSEPEFVEVESYLENQVRACDQLGIFSPGVDLRSQYAVEDNLNRILPSPPDSETTEPVTPPIVEEFNAMVGSTLEEDLVALESFRRKAAREEAYFQLLEQSVYEQSLSEWNMYSWWKKLIIGKPKPPN